MCRTLFFHLYKLRLSRYDFIRCIFSRHATHFDKDIVDYVSTKLAVIGDSYKLFWSAVYPCYYEHSQAVNCDQRQFLFHFIQLDYDTFNTYFSIRLVYNCSQLTWIQCNWSITTSSPASKCVCLYSSTLSIINRQWRASLSKQDTVTIKLYQHTSMVSLSVYALHKLVYHWFTRPRTSIKKECCRPSPLYPAHLLFLQHTLIVYLVKNLWLHYGIYFAVFFDTCGTCTDCWHW